MLHKTIALFITLFISSTCVFSQYTDMINTNRPGVSQGAFSVGTNVLQLETGVSIGKEEHEGLQTETDAFNWDYAIRYGVWKEELEVSLIGSWQANKVLDSRTTNIIESKRRNFRSNTLGAKYLVYDPYINKEKQGPNLYSWKANNRFQWSDLIPAIAVYAGANFDFENNPFTPEPEATISPKVVLSTQNNFVGSFVLVTNIIADRIGTEFPTYGYIVTLTHATNDYFSIFVENQGFKSDFYADQIVRAGAAALINKDLHVDLSLSVNFKDSPSILYGRAGIAYRLDLHKEDQFLEQKGKEGREVKRAEKSKRKANKKSERRKKKNKRKDKVDGGSL